MFKMKKQLGKLDICSCSFYHRSKYQLKILAELMSECHDPAEMSSKLIEYARDITSKSRNFMEIEGRPQPNDLPKFPGKMDHSTVACFKILPSQGS